MGIATHFASISATLFGFWVSSLTGKRFVNEFGDRKLCTDAILNVINAGGEALAFADDDGVPQEPWKSLSTPALWPAPTR